MWVKTSGKSFVTFWRRARELWFPTDSSGCIQGLRDNRSLGRLKSNCRCVVVSTKFRIEVGKIKNTYNGSDCLRITRAIIYWPRTSPIWSVQHERTSSEEAAGDILAKSVLLLFRVKLDRRVRTLGWDHRGGVETSCVLLPLFSDLVGKLVKYNFLGELPL